MVHDNSSINGIHDELKEPSYDQGYDHHDQEDPDPDHPPLQLSGLLVAFVEGAASPGQDSLQVLTVTTIVIIIIIVPILTISYLA